MAALAGFLTFTRVYDAVSTLPFWMGWAYWMLTLLVGTGTGLATTTILEKVGANAIVKWGVATFTSSAAVTLAILSMQSLVGQKIPLSFIPQLFFMVYVISIGVMVLGWMFNRVLEPKAVIQAESNGADPIARFMERLPMKYRAAELYALSSEDHYLRVHTNLGEELILMRLSDAIHALTDANGLQTHRSWWVAADGVEDSKRENGRTVLILKSGKEAPVSRTYQTAVKEAGWT